MSSQKKTISADTAHAVSQFLMDVRVGDAELPNLTKPDLGDLMRWKRVQAHVDAVAGYVKAAITKHEEFLADYAEKHEVGQLGDANLTVTMREDTRYHVKDWNSIDKTLMQKRLTETEVKRALDDADHPQHLMIHSLLASGAIETHPFIRVAIRRKPGAS